MTPLEVDDLHYSSMEQTEEMTFYVPGGYHPIVVGDILGPSFAENREQGYRIMHKLGWGAYSTVWLAQKTDSSQAFVAVKVAMAGDDIDITREAAMLAKAQTNDGKPPHVLTLLDHFTLRGPNGIHSVLVTDIVVPMFSLISRNRDPLWGKTVIHGLTKALASLHATGIIHGGALSLFFVKYVAYPPLDLHIGNFGFAFPQIADQDPDDVMVDLGQHEVIIVLPVSAANQTPSLPVYVLSPCNLAKYYEKVAGKDLPQTKIFDFGSSELHFVPHSHILTTPLTAHEAGTLPPRFQCMARACAPELVFARIVLKIDNPAVEPPADVWALGCAVCYVPFSFLPMLNHDIRSTKFLLLMINYSNGLT